MSLVDFTIASPSAPSNSLFWLRLLTNPTRLNSTKGRTAFAFLERIENRKEKYYEHFLRNSELARSRECSLKEIMDAHHMSFYPAAMSIFGNISPKFDTLIRKVAALRPGNIYAYDSIHPPPGSTAFYAHEMAFDASTARIKCLVAVAFANALASTFSPYHILSSRRNRDRAWFTFMSCLFFFFFDICLSVWMSSVIWYLCPFFFWLPLCVCLALLFFVFFSPCF